MNSRQEKLFEKTNIKNKVKVYRDVKSKYNRSIKTVAQMNENILLAGMTGKWSNDKLLDKHNAETLDKELKPLLIMLRLLGCFPVYFSKSG
jgi:L-cysteine desulfidase